MFHRRFSELADKKWKKLELSNAGQKISLKNYSEKLWSKRVREVTPETKKIFIQPTKVVAPCRIGVCFGFKTLRLLFFQFFETTEVTRMAVYVPYKQHLRSNPFLNYVVVLIDENGNQTNSCFTRQTSS